jgi:hypothetical protein
MEIDFEMLTNWLAHHGLPQYPVHGCGHVMPLQLRSVLKEMNLQRIFSVHTENTRLFAEFMRALSSTIVAPEEQEEYPPLTSAMHYCSALQMPFVSFFEELFECLCRRLPVNR